MRSKEAPANHVTVSWLREVYKGMKIYTKFYTSFTQNVVKISL
jgi:hypothetical protein